MTISRAIRSIIILITAFTAFFAVPVFAIGTIHTGGSIPDFAFQIPIGGNTIISSADITSGRAIALYIGIIYKWAIGFAAVLAVVAITYGGLLWMTAGGGKRTDEAKKVIGNAIAGLLLALCSYLFLATINKDYVTFRPIKVASINQITLVLDKLKAIPVSTSIATRAGTTMRTALPTSVNKAVFTASCASECTGKGTVQHQSLAPVVTENGGLYECNCKESATAAVCEEPNTELSRDASCANVCPVGTYVSPSGYVLKVNQSIQHQDATGHPFYCCSCAYATVDASTPPKPTCGSRKDQVCCGDTLSGSLVCGKDLYPVQKTTLTTENKCQCESGTEGSICNRANGIGCAPGFTCQKPSVFGISFAGPEDGECKK